MKKTIRYFLKWLLIIACMVFVLVDFGYIVEIMNNTSQRMNLNNKIRGNDQITAVDKHDLSVNCSVDQHDSICEIHNDLPDILNNPQAYYLSICNTPAASATSKKYECDSALELLSAINDFCATQLTLEPNFSATNTLTPIFFPSNNCETNLEHDYISSNDSNEPGNYYYKQQAEISAGEVYTTSCSGLNRESFNMSSCSIVAMSGTHEHTYCVTTTEEPTCTEYGERTYMCSCGVGYKEIIPATGHTIIGNECINCSLSFSPPQNLFSALTHIHIWDNGAVTIAPTCTSEGIMTYTCTKCGETLTETITIIGHAYIDGTCEACGAKDPEHINQTSNQTISIAENNSVVALTPTLAMIAVPTPTHAHSYENAILKEATCTENGEVKHVCSCGEEETEVIPATGHNFIDKYDGNGNYTHFECTKCGECCYEHVYELADEIVPTCTTGGYKKYRCNVCGSQLKENLNPMHTYDSTGKCIICGYVDTDIYTAHGRYLATTNMSEYDKMMDIVNFVYQNCHGDCIQCSYAAKSAAQQCGLVAYYVHVNGIDCPILGVSHYQSGLFDATGFCDGCGMGNNHHWIRFDLSNGDFYEFDIQGLGTYCAGPNTEIHKAFFDMWYSDC